MYLAWSRKKIWAVRPMKESKFFFLSTKETLIRLKVTCLSGDKILWTMSLYMIPFLLSAIACLCSSTRASEHTNFKRIKTQKKQDSQVQKT